MSATRSLPVLMPGVAGQRWSCHSCGNCCRTLVGHLTLEERDRIERQDWRSELGVVPVVKVGANWVLNKRDDGACVFLDGDNRCRIHAKYGEAAKPLACRIFPFSVRPVRNAWQASIRFDCPSVTGSQGLPVSQHRAWLDDLVGELNHGRVARDDGALLQRGLRATPEEIDALLRRLMRWLNSGDQPMMLRLVGAARLTETLRGAKLKKVRGPRFSELLDLLVEGLPRECATPPASSTARQRGMLRQLAFAHAEHVTLAEMRSGLAERFGKRLRQLRSAKRFLSGCGGVPGLPGFTRETTFERVESVGLATERLEDIEDLLRRYLLARLEGRTVFGEGYYGWPVFRGLGALWLSVAAAGWLARYTAAVDDRSAVTFEDVAQALGMVDRAATRVPALGTATERARLSYLATDDGVARLIRDYSLAARPG